MVFKRLEVTEVTARLVVVATLDTTRLVVDAVVATVRAVVEAYGKTEAVVEVATNCPART